MNIKKFFAAVVATAVAVSTMAVSAFAAEYNATLGFADTAWAAQDWETTTVVNADGTYTIESTLVANACDFGVFVIDINGMFAGSPEATAVLDKIEVDGKEISFDAAKIIYGDVEEKGNYRIEIYNQYGDTKNDPPVNNATTITESLKVTFTVSGLGGAAEEAAPAVEEAPAADSATTSASTGNAAAASMVAVMAVAGAAAIASKKRN